MTQQQQVLISELLTLPAAKLPRVAEFVANLKKEDESLNSTAAFLDADPFIGMWKGRNDMEESSDWVRNLRAREW
jgi:hypothetical protein